MTAHTLWAIVATLLVSFTEARWRLPEATSSVQLSSNGVTPRPTAPAVIDNYLRARAVDDTSSSSRNTTVFIAPDETCGYISGRPGIAYTCATGYNCVFFTASAHEQGHVGCCGEDDCNLRRACIDYQQFSSQSLCDPGCALDVYTLKCTDATAQYCNTLSFTSGIIDYWCNSRSYSSIQTAYTTFNGETDGRSFSPYVPSSTSISLRSTGTGQSAQPTVDDSASKTTDSSSSSTADSDKDDDGGSSTPVGGIVGGVVGGVAGIGLIGVAAWYFLRRRRLSAQRAAATQVGPHGEYQSPQMQSSAPAGGYAAVPQGQTSYYDPKTASQYGSPQQGGYMVPGQGLAPDGSQAYQQSGTPSQFTSSVSDPRLSQAGSSPTPSYGAYGAPQGGGQPGYQGPQQGVIHEAPGPGMNHGSDPHEMP